MMLRKWNVCLPLLLLFLSGPLQADPPGPPLLWNQFYTVVKADSDEEIRIIRDLHVLPGEMVHVGQDGEDNIFRMPVKYRQALSNGDYRLLGNPPFRYLDPEIDARAASNDLNVWMRGYKDTRIIENIAGQLERNFPDYVRVHIIGRTIEDRPIYALKISDNPELDENEPAFLFNGAHHGNEPLTVDYTFDLAYFLLYGHSAYPDEEGPVSRFYRESFLKQTNAVGTIHFRTERLQSILDNHEIWIVPAVNPDGLEVFWQKNAWAGRKNARDTTSPYGWNPRDGVDLNRNYPFKWASGDKDASSRDPGHLFYRGRGSASEPETQAMIRLAERERFAFSLTYHCYATKILIPYTAESSLSPIPNPAERLGRDLADEGISNRPDREFISVKNLYPVDGTDQDWLFFQFGTMAFIVEGSYLTPGYEPYGRLSVQGVRPISLKAFDLFDQGPTLSIQVNNADGLPLEAHINIREYGFYEGERYTTNPQNGRFDFVLLEGGQFEVEISRDGYQTQIRKVECRAGICPLSLKLTPVRS
ncbi:MAG: hypothetical protein KDK30_01280 [Leptospiraceae bacterium]|nr:hypothetical protein [Leptospiraceae bacterium]